MPIEFINADLEITAHENLEAVKEAFAKFGHRFAEMYCGETDSGSYLASFEIHLDEERDDHTSDEKIQGFCDSIAELNDFPRELWDRATRRAIDLGYLADDDCRPFSDRLSISTLRKMEALGIELVLTIYPQRIHEAEQGGGGQPASRSESK